MPISVTGPALAAPSRVAPPLRAIVRAALGLELRRAGEVAILVTRDPELRELNLRYRKIDRATDVLSFVYRDERGVVDGDLVISLDRAIAQARRFRVTLGREIARLVIHGALHLAGLDHHVPSERRHMRQREEEAMRRAAVAIRELERRLRI